eukprot:TRINITY_DN34964_c0_g1_i1.p1 TRINITY_DN34964_c0_g1~~TRINITY_DN34964_c0_g1_i1.p1  ORF type:complete len:836 (+),score=94.51 TRINITY_DN34964_c0_g1_i1:118-2625(+)
MWTLCLVFSWISAQRAEQQVYVQLHEDWFGEHEVHSAPNFKEHPKCIQHEVHSRWHPRVESRPLAVERCLSQELENRAFAPAPDRIGPLRFPASKPITVRDWYDNSNVDYLHWYDKLWPSSSPPESANYFCVVPSGLPENESFDIRSRSHLKHCNGSVEQHLVMPEQNKGAIKLASDPSKCLRAYRLRDQYAGKAGGHADAYALGFLSATDCAERKPMEFDNQTWCSKSCATFSLSPYGPTVVPYFSAYVLLWLHAVVWVVIIAGCLLMFKRWLLQYLPAVLCCPCHAGSVLLDTWNALKGMARAFRLFVQSAQNGDHDLNAGMLIAQRQIQLSLRLARVLSPLAPFVALLGYTTIISLFCFPSSKKLESLSTVGLTPSFVFTVAFLYMRLKPTGTTIRYLDCMNCFISALLIFTQCAALLVAEDVWAYGGDDTWVYFSWRLLCFICFGNFKLTAALQIGHQVLTSSTIWYQRGFFGSQALELNLWFQLILLLLIIYVVSAARWEAARAERQADKSQLAERLVKRLLAGMCDAYLLLDSKFTVLEGESKLRTMLLETPCIAGGKETFLDYLCPDDKERFEMHIRDHVIPACAATDLQPALALPTRFQGACNTKISCHLFCSCLKDPCGDFMFMIGIEESKETECQRDDISHVRPGEQGRNEPSAPSEASSEASDLSSISELLELNEPLTITYDIMGSNVEIHETSTALARLASHKMPRNMKKLFADNFSFMDFKTWHSTLVEQMTTQNNLDPPHPQTYGPCILRLPGKLPKTYVHLEVCFDVETSPDDFAKTRDLVQEFFATLVNCRHVNMKDRRRGTSRRSTRERIGTSTRFHL